MIAHNTRRKTAPNPLRADPSRTAALRRQFAQALRQRLSRLKAAIVRLVDTEDAFGLRQQSPLALNTRFRFLTTAEQVKAFEDWLRQQLAAELLDPTSEQLYRSYIERGFRQGAGRAFDDTRRSEAARAAGQQPAGFYAGTRDEFLRSAFARPVAIEKVKLLAGRVFTELKGVTEAMATAMVRTLTDGLVRGDSPRVLARELARQVDGIGRRRADLIARTEIIRVHSEGQLEALELLGVEKIGVEVEWIVAPDSLCPLCVAMVGRVFKIKEAHGLLPRHPACRCTFAPAHVGEPRPRNRRRSLRPS